MQLIGKRTPYRVQAKGGQQHTLLVALATKWCRRNGVHAGTLVRQYEDADGNLVIVVEGEGR